VIREVGVAWPRKWSARSASRGPASDPRGRRPVTPKVIREIGVPW